jgi:hypothetical protein
MFKPVTTPLQSSDVQNKPNIVLIRKSHTELIKERALEARLKVQSLKKDTTKLKPSKGDESHKEGTDKGPIESEDKPKTASSEFALAMMEFMKSEAALKQNDLDKVDTSKDDDSAKTEKFVDLGPDQTTKQDEHDEEKTEMATKESIKEADSDVEKVDQDKVTTEAVEVDAKSVTETELQSDADSCLATSIGTMSPVKMLDQDYSTKPETDSASSTKGDDNIKDTSDTGKDSFEQTEESEIDTEVEGNHSNCCHGVVAPALVTCP